MPQNDDAGELFGRVVDDLSEVLVGSDKTPTLALADLADHRIVRATKILFGDSRDVVPSAFERLPTFGGQVLVELKPHLYEATGIGRTRSRVISAA
jgi:hypothetical protein